MKIKIYDNYLEEEIRKLKIDKLTNQHLENYIKKIEIDKYFDNNKIYKKNIHYTFVVAVALTTILCLRSIF